VSVLPHQRRLQNADIFPGLQDGGWWETGQAEHLGALEEGIGAGCARSPRSLA